MAVPVHELRGLLFGVSGLHRRFTQDSPILPEVWFAYNEASARQRVELLLTPHAPRQPAQLAHEIRLRLGPAAAGSGLVYTNTYVAASLTFAELLRAALPLSRWWIAVFGDDVPLDIARPQGALEWRDVARREGPAGWFAALAGAVVGDAPADDLLDEAPERPADAPLPELPLLFSVTLNRPARPALRRSVRAVKADAARRVFQPVCRDLRWAVVDSGIDARHPAFARYHHGTTPPEALPATVGGESFTRVWRTYDFTGLREALMGRPRRRGSTGRRELPRRDPARELKRRLKNGQAVDWDLVAQQLEVPHVLGSYERPEHEQGTHVAGILAACWPQEVDDDGNVVREALEGICPDLELLDLRVLDDDGAGTEFGILGALQFVRHLNARSERRVIHGVNLSFSLDHDAENYACGRTPICEEVERLVKSGVVVVAAAGNEGWSRFHDLEGNPNDGYRALSITDPGNAESAITVGATHRHQPHVYGVSYFSSRGPTGDGRSKPDLVAPGEKIEAPVPVHGTAIKDGTSMAAPHVSGAAALLMARHDELVGDPETIKRILCRTATDLGRERHFQGAGMLDILRAMQAH